MTPPAAPEHETGVAVVDGTTRRRGVAEAEALSRRLDTPMGALGIVFLFVVLGQTLAGPPLTDVLAVVGWVLWVTFVVELGLRAYIAQDQRTFWRRSWWQVLFLAVPFLRVFRALNALRFARVARVARVGGVLTSAVRGSRSAGRLLTSRIGWLAVVTGVVILASSQLLFLLDAFDSYAVALHGAALTTITGQPLSSPVGLARVVEIVLAAYSVAVFATLAGALGAYFLERPREIQDEPAAHP